ncbi:MAG: PucR family transcriptional regulator [Sciscionella sp.]
MVAADAVYRSELPLPGSLTLRAVCDMSLMEGVSVVAGASGLDRHVSRLNVMTVPDIVRWTKPHELLLTTGYPLRESRDHLGNLVVELGRRSVTALAVKLDRYLERLPEDAMATADRIGFPVLTIPHSLAFDDILSVVLSEIANRQARALLRARDVHEILLRASLDGGLEAVLGELSRALDWPGVWCVDHRGSVMEEYCAEDLRYELDERGLRCDDGERLLDEDMARTEPDRVSRLELPVSDGFVGRLVVFHDWAPLDDQDRMMLEQGAMVAALCLSKSSAVVGVNRRFRSNALHGLLLGRQSEVLEVVDNAASFGWDLTRSMRVVVAKPARQPDIHVRDAALAAWESLVVGADPGAAAAAMGPTFVGICGAQTGTGQTSSLWERASAQLGDICEVTVVIGVSDVVGEPARLPDAWAHAVTAADFARERFAHLSVRRYDDLGVVRLVDSVDNRQQVRDYLEETLGPVLAIERRQRTDLLATLDALFAHNLNVAETARAMHFHYNTLRHRVRRLESLLGPFTQEIRLAVRIGVALEVRPLCEDVP